MQNTIWRKKKKSGQSKGKAVRFVHCAAGSTFLKLSDFILFFIQQVF